METYRDHLCLGVPWRWERIHFAAKRCTKFKPTKNDVMLDPGDGKMIRRQSHNKYRWVVPVRRI